MKRGQLNKLFPDRFDFGASNRKPVGVSSFNRLVRQYKANAKRRAISYCITDEEVRALTSANCAYCGLEPRQIMKSKDSNGHYLYNGIDRKEPSLGYSIENCVSCCKQCNAAKSTMTHDAWVSYLGRIIVFHTAANAGFKVTLEKDEEPKSAVEWKAKQAAA